MDIFDGDENDDQAVQDLSAASVRRALEELEAEIWRGLATAAPAGTTSSEPLTVETLEQLRRSLPAFAKFAFDEGPITIQPWHVRFLEERLAEPDRPLIFKCYAQYQVPIIAPRLLYIGADCWTPTAPPLWYGWPWKRLPRKTKKALRKRQSWPWPRTLGPREIARVRRWNQRRRQ